MYHQAEDRKNGTRITSAAAAVLVSIMLIGSVTGCGRNSHGAGGDEITGAGTNPSATAGGLDDSIAPTEDPGQSDDQGGTQGDPGTGTGDGGNEGDGGQPAGEEDGVVEPNPSPKDCVSYNPNTLTISTAGASGWYMKSGTHSIALFDTYGDAQNGVKVARRHTEACYIGRGNDRPVKDDFIVRYWEGASGLPLGQAPTLQCWSYNSANLTIKKDGDAWLLVEGDNDLLRFDTAEDAARGYIVAEDFTKLCFIGLGNDRPVPSRYIVEYWLH